MNKLFVVCSIILVFGSCRASYAKRTAFDKLTVCEAKMILIQNDYNQKISQIQVMLDEMIAKLSVLKSAQVDKILKPFLKPKGGKQK